MVLPSGENGYTNQETPQVYDPTIRRSHMTAVEIPQDGIKSDFVTPTDYRMHVCNATSGELFGLYPWYGLDAPNSESLYYFETYGGTPPWSQPAANAAYENFRNAALGTTSQLGAAFGEWRESLGTITARGTQLATSFSALARRDFSAALRAWKSRPHPRQSPLRRKADEASRLWLEYSFFWKPTMDDIHSACEQMSEPLPSESYSGSRSTSISVETATGPYVFRTMSHDIRHETGAFVVLENPNLFLASELGLVNPLSIAWELIPGSFVLDWLFDIGGFLGSFSDFAGVKVERPWQSHKLTYSDTLRMNISTRSCYGRGVGFIRDNSLIRPMPNLQVEANLGSSLTRAANAIALATQAFLSLTR